MTIFLAQRSKLNGSHLNTKSIEAELYRKTKDISGRTKVSFVAGSGSTAFLICPSEGREPREETDWKSFYVLERRFCRTGEEG
jgi:hypothetical protein